MISESSRAIIKTMIILIISLLAILHESEAIKKSTPDGPSASPVDYNPDYPSASPVDYPSASPTDYNPDYPSATPVDRPNAGVNEKDYTPQYKKFLKACEERMTDQCSDEIFGYILKSKKIGHHCCSKLSYMGPDSHKAFVDREKELIKDNEEKKKVVSKSEELWKKCEKSGKDYPRFPAPEYRPGFQHFLKECEKKMTDKCGDQVVDAVFMKNKQVHKDCCLKVLVAGRECHDELVKGVEKNGHTKMNAREVKTKSEQVWGHCKKITGKA